MALDTPSSIAILGAGPIGLEAALYARFLGYDVQVYERVRVCEHLRRWGHVRLFTPWHMIGSSLGIAALTAQDADWRPPERDALLTGQELVERYYLPLAQSDLLIDGVREQTEVVAIGRETLMAGEKLGTEEREDQSFRILLRDSSGERYTMADAVIDCTGAHSRPNWCGPGGIPAIGECAVQGNIEHGIVDFSGEDRSKYAGRRVLVLGAGHSAATNVVALSALEPRPAITWVTRREPSAGVNGPVQLIADDSLPERDRLARAANTLANAPVGCVAHWPGTWVEAIEREHPEGVFRVRLVGVYAANIEIDHIVANVGCRPDDTLSAELEVRHDRDGSLVQPEPDFYVLGAKSRVRDSQFRIADGLNQIRDLFKIIGDRAGLDLYESIRPLK